MQDDHGIQRQLSRDLSGVPVDDLGRLRKERTGAPAMAWFAVLAVMVSIGLGVLGCGGALLFWLLLAKGSSPAPVPARPPMVMPAPAEVPPPVDQ